MTEQEIIKILKENKAKGIAYLFLPEDVWNWIGENFNNPRLMYLAPNGQWRLFSETDFDDYDNVAFTLPDDYQVKQEPKGEWVEFEIDGDGDFNLKDDGTESTKDEPKDFGFHWSDWGEFLKYSINEKWHYTTFGGWQYKDDKRWYLAPAVKLKDGLWNSYVIKESGEATPVIPVKIKFWREAK